MLQEVGNDHVDAAPTTTIQQLLADHQLEAFDFVKSDIEGTPFASLASVFVLLPCGHLFVVSSLALRH